MKVKLAMKKAFSGAFFLIWRRTYIGYYNSFSSTTERMVTQGGISFFNDILMIMTKQVNSIY
jgi:hypothetical protein